MNIVGIVLCFVGSMIFIIVLQCCLPSNSFKLLGISLKCLEKQRDENHKIWMVRAASLRFDILKLVSRKISMLTSN